VVVALTTDLAPADPLILGLESDVRESLINLIFNAVDAMPEGGTLVTRTRPVDESNGAGNQPQTSPSVYRGLRYWESAMDPETRRRCLEPFSPPRVNAEPDLDWPWFTGWCNVTCRD
jgi:signal transduction histidine kinase